MSRIGKQQIVIPEHVTVSRDGGHITVSGPKGTLKRSFKETIDVDTSDGVVRLAPRKSDVETRALWGTYASHVKNMIEGVTEGFERKLVVEGVGYRAEISGNTLSLSVGYSHRVDVPIPNDVRVDVEKNEITVRGIDKEVVGSFAANVRAAKKPEPYKGKGIRYADEVIIRKQGKKAVA